MSEEKQIDEMAKAICEHYIKGGCGRCPDCACEGDALKLYNAGYRRQREGEWEIKTKTHQMFDDVDEELYVECPFCKRTFWVPYEFDDEKTFEYAREHYPYCNCGAKMGGGEE